MAEQPMAAMAGPAPMEGEGQPMEEEMPEDLENKEGRRDTQQMLDEQMAQDVSPEKQAQVKNVQDMMTDMVYHPDTKASIQSMLKAAPPEQSVPTTVNTVFMKFEDMATQKNKKPMPLDMRLAGGVHLFSEVMEIGEALGVIPEDMQPDAMQPLLKDTMQMYIQKGLKTGSIDPIELQQQIEPLLTDDEMAVGLTLGEGQGVPPELQQAQANEGMYQQRSQPDKLKAQGLEKSNQQMQQALQGIAMKPEEGEEGA